MKERDFPVLDQRDRKARAEIAFPSSVPWGLLAPHEAQARHNHDQSLTRLAERGGLSPCEMLAVLRNHACTVVPDAFAVSRLAEYVAAYEKEKKRP